MKEAIGGSAGVWRRVPVDDAARTVTAWTWSATVPASASALRVLPDACIDLVWDGDRLRVAGPDTVARVDGPPPGSAVLGAQLRPGAAASVLGVPASAVRDDRVDVAELWGADAAARAVDALATAPDAQAAAAALEAVVACRVAAGAAVDRVGAAIRAGRGSDIGLGERQLRRRCTDSFGYGPKLLARVLRFQHAVEALRSSSNPLAIIAVDAGYADQAHFTHEVGALAGITPARLRSMLSDPDKTAAA
jgi:methylphosphotriester-DNA--protein-cysteine methyltransferase